MEQENIQWHPAFVEAIQLELEAYQDSLEFIPEFQLTAGPLRIDCIVVKKAKDVVIEKNIAAMFREVNLLEYKSPDDYVSVEDFYKVYGYACLYASLENTPMANITVSFVESRFPRELIIHLKKDRGYKVEEKSPGIYTVTGDILPIQVIDNRKLSVDENFWLKDLCDSLNPLEMRRAFDSVQIQGKAARVKAWLDAITRANKYSFQEANNMSTTSPTMEEVLKEAGILARVEERNSLKIARNMVDLGFPMDTVVSATQLEPEKVRALYKKEGDNLYS